MGIDGTQSSREVAINRRRVFALAIAAYVAPVLAPINVALADATIVRVGGWVLRTSDLAGSSHAA